MMRQMTYRLSIVVMFTAVLAWFGTSVTGCAVLNGDHEEDGLAARITLPPDTLRTLNEITFVVRIEDESGNLVMDMSDVQLEVRSTGGEWQEIELMAMGDHYMGAHTFSSSGDYELRVMGMAHEGHDMGQMHLMTIHVEGGATGCADLGTTPTKASEWVDFVNWDEATRVVISAHEVSEDNFHFMPDHLEFEAGKPYILVMKSEEGNEEKHYFHAPGFYKAIATRKAQTANAEYKAPYFDDFELKVNGELELYFVPVVEGEYELWCTISGHRDKGMEGEFHITCGEGLSLDLEVDPNFNTDLAFDDRRSGSNLVWESAQKAAVSMVEINFDEGSEELAFEPADLTLAVDTAYVLTIHNPAENSSKHYYTAPEFYQSVVTRKAEDSKAEIKVPYFKAIELLLGGSTELFIVPTVPDTYGVVCTITDHEEFGMVGTITVE